MLYEGKLTIIKIVLYAIIDIWTIYQLILFIWLVSVLTIIICLTFSFLKVRHCSFS